MKKNIPFLAAVIVTLGLAFSSCEKNTEPGDGPTGGSPTSNIIATTFDTPMVMQLNGSIDFEGSVLQFDMYHETTAFHTPFQGVSVLATPKQDDPENPYYNFDEDVLLSEGDEIGPGGYFSKSDTIDFLNWAYYNDVAYCGVSFQKEGKTHYGWVKFKFNTISCRALIYGYAYEAVPNKSIKAGATK